jgi:hypothetical protein
MLKKENDTQQKLWKETEQHFKSDLKSLKEEKTQF